MKLEIGIEGMSCQNCVRHATAALQDLEMVKEVTVSLEEKKALLEITAEIPDNIIKEVLDEAGGYTVTGIRSV